jgi:hypothetical protein
MIAAGVRTIHADVSGSNAATRGLVRSPAGADLPCAYADGLLHFTIDLAAAVSRLPAPMAAAPS